jgi:outer membrane lipoprotein carrier protein
MKSLMQLSLVVLLVLVSLPVQARSLTPVEGLEALRRSFAGLQDFTAEMIQEKQLSIMKKKLVMQGTIRFKKPDRFLMVLDPPYNGTILLKDTVLEQRLGSTGERQRIVLPPEHGLARWIGAVAKPVTSVPEGMTVRAEQVGGLTNVMIRPAQGGQVKELTISLQQDGTVRRLELMERAGDRTVMTFRKTRRNVGLSDADFRLE